MHILVISLLIILAGTLLLAKSQKDMPGKFFAFISWFFIAVGFLVFLGFVGLGIVRMSHHCFHRIHNCQVAMMNRHDHGMQGGFCCNPKHMEKNPGMAEKVPVAVKEAFAKKFPAATDVKFEMEGKDFEISFKDKGVEMSANFNDSGNWLETETGIKESDLPKAVSESVAKNFTGYKISEVAKVETPDKEPCYEMDLNKEKEGYEVQFSAKGDMINKHALNEEKGEEEKEEK
jgi:hypothetical protein